MSDKPAQDGRACFYAILLPRAIKAARECGYALGLHGSIVNDLDLIAVPWIEDAKPAGELVKALFGVLGGYVPGAMMPGVPMDAKCEFKPSSVLPHGRMHWNICWGGHAYLDLSVMPLAPLLPIEPAGVANP